MSSISPDLTPQARIRQAALELLGAQGYAGTTVRQIAARAGVSPGLVIHHFGSKEKLIRAVEAWVLDELTAGKLAALHTPPSPELGTYLRDHPHLVPIRNYLIACLREGGAAGERIFDLMCELGDRVHTEGTASGVFRTSADPAATVALLVTFTAGINLFGDQLARRLGGTEFLDPDVLTRFSLAAVEFFTHGVFADSTYLDAIRTSNPVETPSEEQ